MRFCLDSQAGKIKLYNFQIIVRVMNKRLWILSLFIAVSTALLFVSCNKDDDPEPIGSEWIDAEFARVLEEKGYIKDAKTVTPSEVTSLTEVNVKGTHNNRGEISSLRGLEYFTSLQVLSCGYNQLMQLNISNSLKLEAFSCSFNPGLNGLFRVKAWFDNFNVPESFYNSINYRASWYDDNWLIVKLDYYK